MTEEAKTEDSKPDEPRSFFGWLHRIDDGVFALEQGIVAFSLSAVTIMVFLDVIYRRLEAPDSKLGDMLAPFLGVEHPAETETIDLFGLFETTVAVNDDIAPWAGLLLSLAFFAFAYWSARQHLRQIPKPPEILTEEEEEQRRIEEERAARRAERKRRLRIERGEEEELEEEEEEEETVLGPPHPIWDDFSAPWVFGALFCGFWWLMFEAMLNMPSRFFYQMFFALFTIGMSMYWLRLRLPTVLAFVVGSLIPMRAVWAWQPETLMEESYEAWAASWNTFLNNEFIGFTALALGLSGLHFAAQRMPDGAGKMIYERLICGGAREMSSILRCLGAIVMCYGLCRFAGVYFPEGYTWSKELSLMLVMWVGVLGASVCAHEGKHLRLEALGKLIPDEWQRYVVACGFVFTGVFCALMTVLGFEYIFAPEASDDPNLVEMIHLFGTRYVYGIGGAYSLGGEFEQTGVPDWTATIAIPIAFGISMVRYLGAAVSSAIGGDYGAQVEDADIEEARHAAEAANAPKEHLTSTEMAAIRLAEEEKAPDAPLTFEAAGIFVIEMIIAVAAIVISIGGGAWFHVEVFDIPVCQVALGIGGLLKLLAAPGFFTADSLDKTQKLYKIGSVLMVLALLWELGLTHDTLHWLGAVIGAQRFLYLSVDAYVHAAKRLISWREAKAAAEAGLLDGEPLGKHSKTPMATVRYRTMEEEPVQPRLVRVSLDNCSEELRAFGYSKPNSLKNRIERMREKVLTPWVAWMNRSDLDEFDEFLLEEEEEQKPIRKREEMDLEERFAAEMDEQIAALEPDVEDPLTVSIGVTGFFDLGIAAAAIIVGLFAGDWLVLSWLAYPVAVAGSVRLYSVYGFINRDASRINVINYIWSGVLISVTLLMQLGSDVPYIELILATASLQLQVFFAWNFYHFLKDLELWKASYAVYEQKVAYLEAKKERGPKPPGEADDDEMPDFGGGGTIADEPAIGEEEPAIGEEEATIGDSDGETIGGDDEAIGADDASDGEAPS